MCFLDKIPIAVIMAMHLINALFHECQNKLGKVSIKGCYFWKVSLDVQNQFFKANYFDAAITESQLPWIAGVSILRYSGITMPIKNSYF